MKNDQIIARIREGLEQAQRGDFVSDDEVEEFFARHADSSVDMLWVSEGTIRNNQGPRFP